MIYSFAIRESWTRNRECTRATRRSQRALRRHLNAQQAKLNTQESWDARLDRVAIQKINRLLRDQG
jgi:hypothetical protein